MIKFISVSKEFDNDSYGVKDISFEIDPGELILVTGPSGSGKTTLMRLLTKEYEPSDGSIFFHDEDISDINRSRIHEHRRKIGVVFQDYKLISDLNVWENIALPLSIIGKTSQEIEERVTDLLTLVSLQNKAHLFPKQLSGGEAQRISIARALSTGPKVIFADEPTGNLDKDTSLEIAKLIMKINSLGTTVLFATHDQDVMNVMSSDRHIILDNGQLKSDLNKPKKTKPKAKTQDNKEIKKATKPSTKKTTEIKPVSEEIKTISKKPGFWKRFGKKTVNSKEADKKETVTTEVKKKEVTKTDKKKVKPTPKKAKSKVKIQDKKETKEKE